MTQDILTVFLLLGACILAFIVNRPRMDAVALLALLALVLTGILTVDEALAGFSEPSVVLIAAFFVIGEALVRTGVAYRVGDWLVRRAGNSEPRLLVLLMLAVAGLGSVMSSTGVVAIFIPVTLGIASRIGVPPGRLMMPLAFAGLMSGMLTLVGTPPNMVVNSELARAGQAGFGFFDFTPMGLIVLGLGIAYMLLLRQRITPASTEGAQPASPQRRLRDLARDYDLLGRGRRLQVKPGSPLIGRTLGDMQLRKLYGANVLAIERQRPLGRDMLSTSANLEIAVADVLLVDFIHPDLDLWCFCADMGLQQLRFQQDYFADTVRELGLAEVLVPPDSALVGKSILELRMRSQRGINVVGLRRKGRALSAAGLIERKLRAGDTLLIAGTWKAIRALTAEAHDFLVLTLPAEIAEAAPAARRAPFALISLALTVVLMIFGIVPNVVAALIGCMLLGAFRCIDMDSAYRAIHWQSLLLIVGMLPFALALQKTGGITLIVDAMLGVTGTASPRMVLASLFMLTALVGLFISNTATAVLVAPVALGLAQQLGVSPYPFAMTVALAASAAFMTPVSSPVNTLVIGPGRYRFIDFVRLGVPFTLLVMLACVALLPVFFAF